MSLRVFICAPLAGAVVKHLALWNFARHSVEGVVHSCLPQWPRLGCAGWYTIHFRYVCMYAYFCGWFRRDNNIVLTKWSRYIGGLESLSMLFHVPKMTLLSNNIFVYHRTSLAESTKHGVIPHMVIYGITRYLPAHVKRNNNRFQSNQRQSQLHAHLDSMLIYPIAHPFGSPIRTGDC